jgi:transcriptional regulator with XRE-family HTH domain
MRRGVLPGLVDQVQSHVARILREERERQGLSMTTLAERSGLSQGMISLFEREHRNPSLETLIRIAHVLQVDLSLVIRRAYKAVAQRRA